MVDVLPELLELLFDLCPSTRTFLKTSMFPLQQRSKLIHLGSANICNFTRYSVAITRGDRPLRCPAIIAFFLKIKLQYSQGPSRAKDVKLL